MQVIRGNVVDVMGRRTYPAVVEIERGRIKAIRETQEEYGTYLLPGFVDAHVHVESSMLTPARFAAAAVVHGTVATVSDPHEIANVLGVEGVYYMLDDAARVPFKFAFGAPSCVPATPYETAGARLGLDEVRELLADDRIVYLSEVMNWPGVLQREPEVMAMIAAAHALGKPVDGHAPGLRGENAKRYHDAGIQTDHECFTLAEAHDKLEAGATILIREGSAARNLDALWPLVTSHPGRVALCSDDKHPNDLLRGHINDLCARLVARGVDLYDVLRAACIVPVEHYGLAVGQLRVGDPADFIEVGDLTSFRVRRTWIDGQLVAEDDRSLIETSPAAAINHFNCEPVKPADFRVIGQSGAIRVIGVADGQLVTTCEQDTPRLLNGDGRAVVADPSRDLLKIAVVNRYHPAPPAVAFIRGFGLKRGAIAGSVAHDSHNIIAVGVDDDAIAAAVNAVIREKGGLSVTDGARVDVLPLPIAGLMSSDKCSTVAAAYDRLEAAAQSLGSTLRSPFMTLSFMALLVIPSLKLSDKGLFDGSRFEFTPLFCT